MAGRGSRFIEQGYKLPKPLIDVAGKPMIQCVIENINLDGEHIFVVQEEHCQLFDLENVLKKIVPQCTVIIQSSEISGAASTCLLAKQYINNNDNLLIANSDQIVEFDQPIEKMFSNRQDGCILTFRDINPKWSFAKIDKFGFVTEVAEKNPISDIATVGIYAFKHGKDYVECAEEMIERNLRSLGEFYNAPVYNIMIEHDKRIRTLDCKKMHGIGDPSSLQDYLKNIGS